jgi:hypothetical protein
MSPLTGKKLPLNPSKQIFKIHRFWGLFPLLHIWFWYAMHGAGYWNWVVIPSVADPVPESGSSVFRPLDSGSGSEFGMKNVRDPRSGFGFLCQKYLNSLSTQCCGAGSGIRDPVLIDPGSGSEMAKDPDLGSDINIRGPQHYSDHSSLGTPIPLNTTTQWTVKDAGGGGGGDGYNRTLYYVNPSW